MVTALICQIFPWCQVSDRPHFTLQSIDRFSIIILVESAESLRLHSCVRVGMLIKLNCSQAKGTAALGIL